MNEQLSLFDIGLLINENEEGVNTDIMDKMVQDNSKRRVLSLFSGCGGMDIGFEGDFTCMKRSIKTDIHPNWIAEDNGYWVKVAETGFETVFANDIRPDAKSAWVSYFGKKNKRASTRTKRKN